MGNWFSSGMQHLRAYLCSRKWSHAHVHTGSKYQVNSVSLKIKKLTKLRGKHAEGDAGAIGEEGTRNGGEFDSLVFKSIKIRPVVCGGA